MRLSPISGWHSNLFICLVLPVLSPFGWPYLWSCAEETRNCSRKTVIVVDLNDRAASRCGQTDSRSPTRAVGLMNEIPRHSPHVFDNRKSVCVRENASACLTASNRPPDQTAKLFTEGVGRKGEPEGRGKPLIKTVQLSSHTSSTIKKVTALFFTSFQKVFRWKTFKGCVWTVKKKNQNSEAGFSFVTSRYFW